MGEGQWGKIGEGLSSNMHKGHMDKARGCRFEGGKQGWVGRGSGGVKMETIVLEQQ